MRATATKRIDLPAVVAARLLWCERIVQLADRHAFYSRVRLESVSRGESEVAQLALRKIGEIDAEFWTLSGRGGCKLGKVNGDEIVTAARRYIAEVGR